MVLVCGIHGSGKDQFCNNLKLKEGLSVYTASQLINRKIPLNQNKTKMIDKISSRQQVLLEEIHKILRNENDFILNAHLCLINKLNQIERVSLETFYNMPISEIHLVECSSAEIKKRIYVRDGIVWEEPFIEKFILEERKYAYELSKLLNIQINVINTSTKVKQNIILPITPKYIEKIFSGEKKYEYRKRLCKNNIVKIYLYATAPVKGIVGEVEVVEKLEDSVENLWNVSSEYSGIEEAFYKKYFATCEKACAYRIGHVKKYVNAIPLINVGIDYVIQSFTYINDI